MIFSGQKIYLKKGPENNLKKNLKISKHWNVAFLCCYLVYRLGINFKIFAPKVFGGKKKDLKSEPPY